MQASPATENCATLSGSNQASFAKLINLLLFQGVWFLAVLGAAAGNGWVGAVGLIVFLAAHQLSSPTARADYAVAAGAVFIGLLVETSIVRTGLIEYRAALPADGFAPLWLLVLWAAFALTMNGCIAWLHGRYVLAALLGGVGGPLSYYGGVKLGAATTTDSVTALAVIAVVYAIVTPALLFAADKLARRWPQTEPG